MGDVRGCQSLGVVGLDVEAFFISPGAFSPMRVEENARDDAFPLGHNGSGSHRGHFMVPTRLMHLVLHLVFFTSGTHWL